jgi:hypothetical protein
VHTVKIISGTMAQASKKLFLLPLKQQRLINELAGGAG